MLGDLGVMPYDIKIIINTAYEDTQYTGMNQVSFQCRLFFLAAKQTIGFNTMKLLGYLNNRGFLTKVLYNKTFPPVNFGTCIAASKTQPSKLYRFHSA